MYDLIVIGAGPGGYEAAAHAANLGKSVALFEKKHLGGVCLNVGCIPTKTLLRSARTFSECREAGLFGVETSEPAIHMPKVQERKRRLVQTLGKGVQTMMKQAGVEVIHAEARLAGRGRVTAGGTEYEAEHILLATGSVPAVPPIPGIDSPAVVDSTGILDVSEVPETLTVIGGGVIGLEFACFFAELGTEVTVVEMLPRIAYVVDEEIGDRLQRTMKKAGVTFHLSSRVTGIDGNRLSFTDADGKARTLETTLILNSTGRAPVVEGLGLDRAGVEYDRGGIRADDTGRTNVPGIWACGDVTGRCMLAHSATREGQVAVNNMFGRPDRMRFDAVPSVIYTHPEVANVGASEADLQEAGIAYRKKVMPMAIAGRFMVEHERQAGHVKILVDEEYGQVLGVHMIGDACGEFIASAAMMVELELRVKDVEELVFPHPTVSEALKETVIRT